MQWGGRPSRRIGIDAPNGSEDEFGIPVGEYLEHRCGSLDCHGQVGRNLQIWGCEGMRLDAHDVPFCSAPLGGRLTTRAEHQATYRSLVGLEPTLMSAVVDGYGAHPELLTFVRKARGLEAHKDGVLITPGDDQDICITSWLAGKTDPITNGPWLLSAGGGAHNQFSPRAAFNAALRVSVAFGAGALFTYGPEIAMQYGF